MSGVAGGDRIQRADFDKVVNDYIKKVLEPYHPGIKWKISGSYHNPAKMDFGDIDLIITLPGTDKKQVKLDLQKYLESLPDSVVLPFKSEKYRGKRSYNSGEIVSILYPQGNGKTAQIDNMVSLSAQETDFKGNFLDLPAEKQGLVLGLVKVACIEEDPRQIFKRLKIKNVPDQIPDNQEFEFNLSGQNLTLRLLTYEEAGSFKEIDRQDLWKSNNWQDVVSLLNQYDFSMSFEDLLKTVNQKLKNPRSKNRVLGVFKSMISVKSGEVGTAKGAAKEKALQDLQNTLNLSETIRFIDNLIVEAIKKKHKIL